VYIYRLPRHVLPQLAMVTIVTGAAVTTTTTVNRRPPIEAEADIIATKITTAPGTSVPCSLIFGKMFPCLEVRGRRELVVR